MAGKDWLGLEICSQSSNVTQEQELGEKGVALSFDQSAIALLWLISTQVPEILGLLKNNVYCEQAGGGGRLGVTEPHPTDARGTSMDFRSPKPATSAFPPSHLLWGMGRGGVWLGGERQVSAKLLDFSQLILT